MALQSSLKVDAPNDACEQEADRVSESVSRRLATNQMQRQVEEEEVQTSPGLQRRASEPAAEVSSEIEDRINASRSGGQHLGDDIRGPMEQAFGVDFSSVKVHTDAGADTLNKSLQARAFATGRDIFFRQNEFNPGTDSGKKLIAHELTHVVQQGAAGTLNPVQRKDEPVAVRVSALRNPAARAGMTQIRRKPVKLNKPPELNGVTNKNKSKPVIPPKTYYLEKPKELVEKGGKPRWYSSKEYTNIVRKTRYYYSEKVNSPGDYKKQAFAIDDILKNIEAWWGKYRIFSRKSRREALTRLEGQLKKEKALLLHGVTSKQLVPEGPVLEKYDAEHREGGVLYWCFKKWQAEGKKKARGVTWSVNGNEFYKYVDQLEQTDDEGLKKEVRKYLHGRANKIKDDNTDKYKDDWMKRHQQDKKYIPRIQYVAKEKINRRKVKFSGTNLINEYSNKPLIGDCIYVLSPGGDFYAAVETRATQLHFHHSSLLAGEDVAAAGHMKGGGFLYLDLESGHYKPGMQHMYNAVKALKDKGVDLTKTMVKITHDAPRAVNANIFIEGIQAIKAGKGITDEAVINVIKTGEDTNINLNEGEMQGKFEELQKEVSKLKM